MTQATFNAATYTADHTGRGRPDQTFGGDHTDTVYIGTPANLLWVLCPSTGNAALALLQLRKRLVSAVSESQWREIAQAWYDEQ